jgi:hypothetical protein
MENYKATNISIYRSIVEESYAIMSIDLNEHRIPKKDGTNGFINIYDPNHKSFKHALITIVFTGMWLEALIHLHIVKKYSVQEFKKYDKKKGYEERIKKIGISDEDLIERIISFRKSRKAIEHEKAYLDKDFKFAQDEAEKAYSLVVDIEKAIKES